MGNDHTGTFASTSKPSPATSRPLSTGAVMSQLHHNPQPLQRRVIFKKEEQGDQATSDELQQRLLKNPRYIPINVVVHKPEQGAAAHVGKPQETQQGMDKDKDKEKQKQQMVMLQEKDLTALGFVSPQRVLCKREAVERLLTWPQPRKIGPGLNNLGNTCFLNSVLQCLTYTPPLAQYFLSGEHHKQCKIPGFCMMCELEIHVNRCFDVNRGKVLSPNNIVGQLRNIAKHMRFGRQEDAHEFTRYVVEGLQKSSLSNHGDTKLDNRSKETSLVHQIFGGYLQSQVKCHVCHHESNVFDPFLDLSLDLRGCNSVEKALQQFTSPELLSGQNKYKCERCKRLVDATKRFTIFQAPNVLTVQLKRFDFMRNIGGKITRFIEYPERISFKPYMSKRCLGYPNPVYKLFGVLVHAGHALHSGHYYSFVKNTTGTWYDMNDEWVREVGLKTALEQCAYMLFYTLDVAETKRLSGFAPTPPVQRPLSSSSSSSSSGTTLQASTSVANANGPTEPKQPHQTKPQQQVETKKQNCAPPHQRKTAVNGAHTEKAARTSGETAPPKASPLVNGAEAHTAAEAEHKMPPSLDFRNGKRRPQFDFVDGWLVTDADLEETAMTAPESGWAVKDPETPKQVNGNGSLSGKRRREEPSEAPKTVTMDRGFENGDYDMSSVTDSDEESAPESSDEEYKEQFSEEELPPPSKKLKADAGASAPVFKWDDKDKPPRPQRNQQGKAAKADAKKVNWERTMKHEQYDKQVPNWENPSWHEINERKNILKSSALHYVPERFDQMDAEYDAGKKKKVKAKKNKFGNGSNPFQHVQDHKNKSKTHFHNGWKNGKHKSGAF